MARVDLNPPVLFDPFTWVNSYGRRIENWVRGLEISVLMGEEEWLMREAANQLNHMQSALVLDKLTLSGEMEEKVMDIIEKDMYFGTRKRGGIDAAVGLVFDGCLITDESTVEKLLNTIKNVDTLVNLNGDDQSGITIIGGVLKLLNVIETKLNTMMEESYAQVDPFDALDGLHILKTMRISGEKITFAYTEGNPAVRLFTQMIDTSNRIADHGPNLEFLTRISFRGTSLSHQTIRGFLKAAGAFDSLVEELDMSHLTGYVYDKETTLAVLELIQNARNSEEDNPTARNALETFRFSGNPLFMKWINNNRQTVIFDGIQERQGIAHSEIGKDEYVFEDVESGGNKGIFLKAFRNTKLSNIYLEESINNIRALVYIFAAITRDPLNETDSIQNCWIENLHLGPVPRGISRYTSDIMVKMEYTLLKSLDFVLKNMRRTRRNTFAPIPEEQSIDLYGVTSFGTRFKSWSDAEVITEAIYAEVKDNLPKVYQSFMKAEVVKEYIAIVPQFRNQIL